MAVIERPLRPTCTAVELNHGDTLKLITHAGEQHTIEVINSYTAVNSTDLETPREGRVHARTVLRCHIHLRVDGVDLQLVRWVGNDQLIFGSVSVSRS